MRYFSILLLLVLTVVLTGCDGSSKSTPVAPSGSQIHTVGDADGGLLNRKTITVNGVEVPIQKVVVDRTDPNRTRYTIYTADCTLEADYPTDFIGPPAPGHAYQDGSGGVCP